MTEKIKINRAPVLTLWAAVVAERLGFRSDEALTLAKAVAGMNAQSKGRRLGIYPEHPEPKTPEKVRPQPPEGLFSVELLGRLVPAVRTKDGVRALAEDKPIPPDSVQRYLETKFGEALPAARRAMQELAASYPPEKLEHKAYQLYEAFRPGIPEGARGWGAKGDLDLGVVERLKGQSRTTPGKGPQEQK